MGSQDERIAQELAGQLDFSSTVWQKQQEKKK